MILRIFKWAGITAVALLLIVCAAVGAALFYLTPERLTPIVNREASRYLDADVDAGRVEISFWSTFPRFALDISDLRVRSRALDNLPDNVRGRLPEWADSLLTLDRLQAGVNIPKLLTGTIHLYDITLTHPAVNIVQATPEVSSIDIFPKTEEKKDTAATRIPDITISTFRIEGGMPVRYLSLPDTLDVSANMAMTLSGTAAPTYNLDISGKTSVKSRRITISRVGLGLGGDLRWSPKHPTALGVDDLVLSIDNVSTTISGDVDFGGPLRVNALTMAVPRVPLADVISLIPRDMRGELDKLDPKFDFALDASLTAPYTLGEDTIPSFTVTLRIPDGSAVYDTMRLEKIQVDATADVDGHDIDRSVLTLDNLRVHGIGLGFVLSGTVTTPLSDPHIKGVFKGGISFGHLSRRVLAMIPGTVKGRFTADASFELRRSWLDKDNFHRIKVLGSASLDNLDVNIPAFPIEAFARHIDLRFGSSQSFVRTDATVDSLLTASLKVDTIHADLQGIELRGADLAVGVGCRNVASTADTTVVNPIGARLSVGRFFFRSPADSLMVSARKAQARISVTRYKGYARLPQLRADVEAGRAFYAGASARAMLSNARAGVNIHPRMSTSNIRRLQRLDSLRRANPGLSRDSLEALYASTRTRRSASATDSSNVAQTDLAVDGSIRRFLRRWDARGRLSAARISAFSPLFPLRTRITDLDMRFSTDSVEFRETHVRVGGSDFRLDGTISDINQALTSRRAKVPVKIRLDLTSDTINVNQIASAVFQGSAYAQSHEGGAVTLTEATDADFTDTALDRAERDAASDSMAILVIPANIDASLDIHASNIIYSDLVFKNFRGVLNCLDGALNLDRLSASTDVGSIALNALYAPRPDAQSANFAFGLQIKEFRIREFLDLIPAVDSLMPLLNGISGVVDAGLAATTDVDRSMNIEIPSLKAAVRISGKQLKVIDDKTFRTVGKWLLFKDKERNIIDSMAVEAVIDNSQVRLFPFIFSMDRYRLGVSGHNDLALNLNYHVAVLKSPIPFKFGINITGNPDKMKIRLGRAKFNENSVAETMQIADTTRVNLVRQIADIFRRGVRREEIKKLDFSNVSANILRDDAADLPSDTISRADSLVFIREGLIAAPDTVKSAPAPTNKKQGRKKNRK